MSVKTCTKCGGEFPATTEYFNRSTRSKDGLYGSCKICRKLFREENKEGILLANKARYENNKERILNQQKEYYLKNKGKRLQYAKKYRTENKEKISIRDANWRQNNKEKKAQTDKEYREKNKEKLVEKSKRYQENNKEKIIEHRKEYYIRNKDILSTKNKNNYIKNKEVAIKRAKEYVNNNKYKVLQYKKQWNKNKLATNPRFKLNSAMTGGIYKSIRGKKAGMCWESFVGYTLEELMQHLEKQFLPGMNWENYGFYGWHVDHKKPKASFNFSSPKDEEFKQCWSLENLQPLWAEDNLRKHAKWK